MKKFNERKYVLGFILLVFVSLITLVGGSYALIQRVIIGKKTYSMKTGNFIVEFIDSKEITLSNELPVYDNVGIESEKEFVFSVTNNGNYISSYSVKIEETSDSSLKDVIRYAIDYGNGYSLEKIYALKDNQYIIQNRRLEVSKTDNYKLKFWLDVDTNENYASRGFSAKVVIEATQSEYKYGTNVLDAVFEHNLAESDGLIFISKETGLKKTNFNKTNISDVREYRYTGNNSKNYVWFNCDNGYTKGENHCEKWRIIGSFTNAYENGVENFPMLKIVRDESLNETRSYNNSENFAIYENSTIQKYLNNNYYNTFSNDTKNLIINAKWNVGEILDDQNLYSIYNREIHDTIYQHVGLLNITDYGYTLSSDNLNINGNPGWLASNDENILLLNPYSKEEKRVYYATSSGLTLGDSFANYHIRPVVYLKPDVSIVDGDGTLENPYELVIKFPMVYGVKTKLKTTNN